MQISNRVYLAGSQTTLLTETEQDIEALNVHVIFSCQSYLQLNITFVLICSRI